MTTSTKDEVKGTFHEVKGKIKETAGRSQTILIWRPKAKPNTGPGKSRKRSARSKRSLRNKIGI